MLHHWTGMIVFCLGISSFAATEIFHSQEHFNHIYYLPFSIILLLSSQILQAIQINYEETLMKDDRPEAVIFHPLNIVYMEGLWGLLIFIFLVFPIQYATPGPTVQDPHKHKNHSNDDLYIQLYHGNIFDAFVQMFNNPILIILHSIIIITFAFYNYFIRSIIKKLSSVNYVMFDSFRIVLVWVTQYFLYYINPELFGDLFIKTDIYNGFQILGLILLAFGILTFKGYIHMPCSVYPIKMPD